MLFGATGDLAYKKLFPALYRMERAGKLGIPVIGVAFSELGDEGLRARAEESIRAFYRNAAEKNQIGPGEALDEDCLAGLLARISMVAGDYRNKKTFTALGKKLKGAQRPLHYLAIPPALFSTVVSSLKDSGLAEDARVVVEKPFGRNRSSAARLNAELQEVFPEKNIFRIDHFLGKNAIENVLVSRLGNLILASQWSRDSIESVSISMLESFGVEGRGAFYDAVGAISDVVQNHLLEILALLAMEPPVSLDAERIADEKVKLLRSVREIAPEDVIRGQYRKFRDEAGVESWSSTETYAAMKLYIDNWRWQGVPFFIRTGKSLHRTATEAVITFKKPPQDLFGKNPPNQLRFGLTGDGSVTFDIIRKAEEELTGTPVRLTVPQGSTGEGHLPQDAYSRLLRDAIKGRKERFAREDSVDQAWRIVDRVIGLHEVELYESGTWGPREADDLIGEYGPWPEPL